RRPGRAVFRRDHAREAPAHVVGGQLGAVVEARGRVEVEGVGEAVLGHLPGGGERGDDVEPVVEGGQRLVEVLVGQGRGEVRLLVGVERDGVGLERPGELGRPRNRRRRGGGRRRAGRGRRQAGARGRGRGGRDRGRGRDPGRRRRGRL